MGKKKPVLVQKTADEVASELLQFKHIQSLTKIRGNARREITNTCKAIRALIAEEGSRSTITRLLGEATAAYNLSKLKNSELTDASTDRILFDKQQEDQRRYLDLLALVDDEVEEYLSSRKDDVASRISRRSKSKAPSSDGSSDEERASEAVKLAEKKSLEAADATRLLEDQLQKAKDAEVVAKKNELDATAAFKAKSKHRSSQGSLHASENYKSKVDRWRAATPNISEEENPDSWIVDYCAGVEPVVVSDRGKSSVKIPLEVFSGKAVDWFSWIDLFKSLVHETSNSPGVKLAILKVGLRGNCLLSIAGFGGGEAAYKQALLTLKQDYGRLDVMRAAHVNALKESYYNKSDPASLQRFANVVRTHLFELSRIGESSPAAIIDEVSLKLQMQDRLAWNEGRGSGLETRSLNEFGSWLCNRASAYQNAHSLADSQSKGDNHGGGRDRRNQNTRAHQFFASTEGSEPKKESIQPKHQPSFLPRKPKCFKCEKEHRLVDCRDFKALTLADREKFIREHRLCVCCFGTRHLPEHCKWFKGCGVTGCTSRHHTLLHPFSTSSATVTLLSDVTKEAGVKKCTTRVESQRVALGVIQAEAFGADGTLTRINVMYDEGADSTLIREGLASSLKLKGEKQSLDIDGAAGVRTRSIPSQMVELRIKTDTGDFTLKGSTLPTITRPVPVVDWNKLRHQWKHLADLPLKKSGGAVDVLIGLDHAHLMVPLESRVAGPDAPIASRSALGWMVRGVFGKDVRFNSARISQLCASVYGDFDDSPTSTLDEDFRQFVNTENFGTEHTAGVLSPDDKKAVLIVEEGLVKLDVGYKAPIPWKDGEPSFDLNRSLAETRLKFGVFKKFGRIDPANPRYEIEYRGAMQKNFDKCYAEFLEDDDPSPKWFLPHHGVYKSKYDRKLRVVFDGAAKWRGKCLNDAIYGGPALLNELPSVFIKFMESEISFAADIEGMFPKVRLSEEDANYQCFLWPDETGRIRVARMNRLTFGLVCSPYIAIRTMHRIAETVCKGDPEVIAMILNNFYMDDLLSSRPKIEEAISVAKRTSAALDTGDFHLQGWISNSVDFIQNLEPERLVAVDSSSSVPLCMQDTKKLLGIHYKPGPDLLTFRVRGAEDVEFTRVGILSKVAEHFDPLGHASPMTVKAKIRMQRDGDKYRNWNDELGEDDKNWWIKWFEEMLKLNAFETPRCLFPDEENIVKSELHTFCDASEEAYAAMCYTRNVYKDGRVKVRLVMAKTKVAPKKRLSVPRLELNAALLGSRLAAFVMKSLSPERRVKLASFFWTDSSCTRNWVRATAQFYNSYIGGRLGEIQTLTDANQWRFVPGKLNPSDLATRSLLDDSSPIPHHWFEGPDFLQLSEEHWPKDLPWMPVTEELRSVRANLTLRGPILDWKDLFISTPELMHEGQLEESFKRLVLLCQSEAFEQEIECLKKKKPLPSSSQLLELTPFLDADGLLRVGGRIGRTPLPWDTLHQPILPSRHPLTKALLEAYHRRHHHVGTEYLLGLTRQYFWILQGRGSCKKVRYSCAECVREKAKPFAQLMGDLPSGRLEPFKPAFYNTAVDCFGPVECAQGRGRFVKQYGVVFTCLTTRAVYVDSADSLSTEDFFLPWRRFLAIYNWPKKMYSDNGTNFVGAEKVMAKDLMLLLGSEAMKNFAAHHGFEWVFQPPSAPHFGGAHEALVKSAKKALYKMMAVERMALRAPSPKVFQTLLFEVAGLLNCRPLTYVSSDPNDYRPLTPNDFLAKAPTQNAPAGDFDDANPLKQYNYLQRCVNLFWDLWIKIYLQTLVVRRKWKQPKVNIRIGEAVMIMDHLPRGTWRTGRVTEVFPGHDGLVRVVNVKTEDGTIFLRPIHKLCSLELDSTKLPGPDRLVSGENVPDSNK